MYVLALDQGTTSSRAILFDQNGGAISTGQVAFEQYFPKPGWVEHDADEIWQSQLEAMHQAITNAGISVSEVQAIGVTNQRETIVLWDRDTGIPVHHAIVWQDRRTAQYCEGLKEHQQWIQKKTGLTIDPYFSASKVHWLLSHCERAKELLKNGKLAAGTIDSWLVWKLTGGKSHVTDVSNASRTMLMSIESLDWDDELLELFDIPRSILPKIVSNSEVVGTAKVLGGEIPVSGMVGDQQAALFGQQCVQHGMVKNTYGTGCFLLMNTGSEIVYSENKLLTTLAWKLGDEVSYALEGSVFSAGCVVHWLQHGLGIINSPQDLECLVESVADCGEVVMIPAFSGLGAPHWDPQARGMIGGITRGSTAAHIARAAVESIAYQVDELLEAMVGDAGMSLSEIRVDGGCSQSDFLMQFQSDISQCHIARSANSEATALGAAYMAGLAVGFWETREEVEQLWRHAESFKPKQTAAQVLAHKQVWRRSIERAKAWPEVR